ncbi:MAG: hypothetical protein LBT54_00980, partial [Bifidobacteriaceae bacterium]|nr:hypothetical protein [Bifidobacteriaceae bacterium]
ESGPDEDQAVGRVTVTVRGGRVAEADFGVFLKDGTSKDEYYGAGASGALAGSAYYAEAQAAVAAFDVYAARLVEVGYPEDVDLISGATWAHGQFIEAATAALEDAQEAAGAAAAG